MKKIAVAVLVALMMIGSFVAGGMSVIRSEGWIDFDRDTFVVDWAGNAWEWDISEE